MFKLGRPACNQDLTLAEHKERIRQVLLVFLVFSTLSDAANSISMERADSLRMC